MTVDIQVAATDGDPVFHDISYLVQYLLAAALLDIKAKFISPIDCRSLIKQNGNYQQAYTRRFKGA